MSGEIFSLLRAMKELASERIILDPVAASDRLILTETNKSWDTVASYLSKRLGGQHWVGGAGCVWRHSRSTVWIARRERDADGLTKLMRAREICEQLTGEEAPWSISSCARKILAWTGVSQPQSRQAERIRHGSKFHFHRVVPGRLPWAHAWDVIAYYYSLLARMVSPKIYLQGDEVRFHRLGVDNAARWQDMMVAIGQHKRLRNAMIGTMLHTGGGRVWVSGKVMEHKRRPGPLRPAGNLVVRTAYELTALASDEAGSVHSVTDSVISPYASPPATWTRAGLRVALKAEGPCEIYNFQSFRVGDRSSAGYVRGSRKILPEVSLRVEGPGWHRWLLTG